MTLEQLAERASLTPNYLGTIEAGRRDPSLSTVMGIAEGLQIPVGELLGGGSVALGPAALEAGRLFEASPTDVQAAVLVLLRSVARPPERSLQRQATNKMQVQGPGGRQRR